MKITPVLMLESIEPALPFWVDRLGFSKVVEVPEGQGIGFAILRKGDAEVMLQTWESVKNDISALAGDARNSKAMLFVEVPDFDDVVKRLEGIPPVIPIRTTFYGMKEILVRDTGGNIICFAAKVEPQ